MQGQPLVHESIVGVQQIEHAAVFALDAVDEQFQFTPKSNAQAGVEIRINKWIWIDGIEVAQLQPFSPEVGDQGSRPFTREHSPDLLFEHLRVCELALLGYTKQLGIGNRAPQEEREARG